MSEFVSVFSSDSLNDQPLNQKLPNIADLCLVDTVDTGGKSSITVHNFEA